MAGSRKLLTVGALGVASFALIGAGATATFNDEATGSQTVRTGVLKMNVRGDGANTDGKTVTWTTDVHPVGSTFTSGTHKVWISNDGTIPAKKITLTQVVVGAGSNADRDDALYKGIYVEIQTHTGGKDFHYKGPLSELPSSTVVNTTIPVDHDFLTDVTYYAGSNKAASLVNGAQDAAIRANWKITFEG